MIAQLQNEKRNLEELLKRASPPSDSVLPSAWTNPRFDTLPAKHNKVQHAVAFGFSPEAPFTTGPTEQEERLVSYYQGGCFPNGTPGQSNRYRNLASPNDSVLLQNDTLEIPVRNSVNGPEIHLSQRDRKDAPEYYPSTRHHSAYDAGQVEAISIDQLADLRNGLASRSTISEPCSPTKKAPRKASTSSDSKSRAAIVKRSWKPPTPPSSQHSEEAWQVTTFQLPSHTQKPSVGKKSRSGSHVTHIDTSHQDSHAVESPLPSASQAQQNRSFKVVEKRPSNPKTQQSNGWYNAFPMPQANHSVPALIGGVPLPLRRDSTHSYHVNLPGPFNFLGRDLESAPQYQQQAVGPHNVPDQHTAAFPGSCDVQMQDPNCFVPWAESHQWPTWQEAPVSYQ